MPAEEIRKSTAPPADHRKALDFIDDVTSRADAVQRRVLSEILSQNAPAEYLRRHGLFLSASGANADAAAVDFKRLLPVVTYEDIQPDIDRIANGDTSPILSGRPISEFLTSSGTSGGERKLMPTIEDELDRRAFLYSLLMPVMNQHVSGLEKGKGMYLLFVKSEAKTPGGLAARPVLTSYYKSRHFSGHRPSGDPYNQYTSPTAAVLCTDSFQSMYAQLLCGLVQRDEVLRVGAVFASGFIRAIRFLEKHWPRMVRDIRDGVLDAEVADPAVREAVSAILRRPDPELAAEVEAECRRSSSWERIIPRLWPNTKYIDVIVTGAMAQYIPTLRHYGGAGLHLACTMYASSECYFGVNLDPISDPSDVAYTLIPTMAYFEFLPMDSSEDVDLRDRLVDLVDVKLGKEYELVVTTYSGLCRYRVGDVLRVAGFKNKAPQFGFVRRKNVLLSIDSDKTDEVELHAAVQTAATHLEPFGATLFEYTSYADAGTAPGHYVLYWELRRSSAKALAIPPSVFEDCCLAVEESLNSVYRQGRAADGSIGPLEVKVVEEGTFDKLMDYALSRGASINQYKAPRCVRSGDVVRLLDDKVKVSFFSPKCPKWAPGHKQWNSATNGGGGGNNVGVAVDVN